MARFRDKYAGSYKEQCAKLAMWLLDRIDAGDFDDAEIRSSFGFSTVEYISFRNEINNLRSNWRNIQNARGR